MPRRPALIQMLRSFQPHDSAEQRDIHRMLALAEHPDAFTRTHYVPGHFTASAFILSPDESSLLLIHHSKLHRWLQPGGHVDPEDADIIAAARREVSEEVGLNDVELLHPTIFDADIHPIPARATEPGHEHFDVRFLFRSPTWDALAASDAQDHRWLKLEEITEQFTDQSVMRAVGRLKKRKPRD